MKYLFLTILICAGICPVTAQQKESKSDSIMVTIFLKHQQDKNLDSLQAIQQKNKFLEMFPPSSARVVSWYVMMGIGQVVTVKLPASEVRILNRSIEKGAWGAFNTEFYLTYDFMPVWEETKNKH